MKSHKQDKPPKKIVLVISDLHLSAGKSIKGRRNFLEDFHHDTELIDFLDYYSTGFYENLPVELIINGDFLDFLAVPYVEYFDDEFWCEDACLEKLKLIMQAHSGVMHALKRFISKENKKIVYIIGNHDAEFVLDKLKIEFLNFFGEFQSKIILSNDISTYVPTKGVYIQHGHQYEIAHNFDPAKSVVDTPQGQKYFIPSWGSYYVINVINRFKHERSFINAVRPIKHFLIHGLIFDTFFTIRFMLSNAYYFLMVRFWYYFMMKIKFSQIIKDLVKELSLFQDFETLTRDFFEKNAEARVLIVGHTHNPTLRLFNDGTIFVNTGTWTHMVNLDLAQWSHSQSLTFAKIVIYENEYEMDKFHEFVEVDLKVWQGIRDLPYSVYY
jgi:UDP-2,3-diacylglucosamine pyrophosphatase LpxH